MSATLVRCAVSPAGAVTGDGAERVSAILQYATEHARQRRLDTLRQVGLTVTEGNGGVLLVSGTLQPVTLYHGKVVP